MIIRQIGPFFIEILFYLSLLTLVGCQGPLESETEEEVTKSDYDSIVTSPEVVSAVDTMVHSPSSLIIVDPDETLKRIFTSFTEFQESTDSAENLDSMRQAIKLVGQDSNWIAPATLSVLLDIWMYYDVTDFPKREYVEKRLAERPHLSISAIDRRIHDKHEWEDVASSPLSELSDLREKLMSIESDY